MFYSNYKCIYLLSFCRRM